VNREVRAALRGREKGKDRPWLFERGWELLYPVRWEMWEWTTWSVSRGWQEGVGWDEEQEMKED
jgi:hypothetical protein